MQYAGWPGEETPPDSSVSSFVVGDEDFGLSSLQHKKLKVRDEDDETQEVDIASIYKFDDVEYKSDIAEEDLSTCHVLVRHYDEDANTAVVEYKTLSSIASEPTTVDSKCETLYLSSIQDGTYEDQDGNERKYH